MEKRTVLYAEDGKVLTDGEVYGKVIFLSETDDIANYTEITDEEYDQIMAKSEAEGDTE